MSKSTQGSAMAGTPDFMPTGSMLGGSAGSGGMPAGDMNAAQAASGMPSGAMLSTPSEEMPFGAMLPASSSGAEAAGMQASAFDDSTGEMPMGSMVQDAGDGMPIGAMNPGGSEAAWNMDLASPQLPCGC